MCHQLDNERWPEGNKAKISYMAGNGRFVLSKPMLAKIMYDNSSNLAKLLIIELGQEALLPLKI